MRFPEARLQLALQDVQHAGNGTFYKSGYDLVLREGDWFTPRRLPAGVIQGPPRRCYHNALMLAAVRGWAYVEGYAINGRSNAPISHAWNLDENGKLVDATWDDRLAPVAERAYRGIPFSAARGHDATWHGDACVIEDHRRGDPLLHRKWEGEDSPGDIDGLLEQMMSDISAEFPGAIDGKSVNELVAAARRTYGPQEAPC